MEPDQEAKVWQRVMAKSEVRERADLRQLLLAAADRAAVYRRLYRENPKKELVRRLYEGEMGDIACLRGMCALSGIPVKHPAMSSGKESAGKALEKCYHQTRRAMAEYTARSADPEFGAVFGELARGLAERCAAILKLLGSGDIAG